MTIRRIALSMMLMVAGCYADPFTRAPLPRLIHPDPEMIRDHFAHDLPNRFTSDDTVIIESPFVQIVVLAVLRVNRSAGTFELIGLNPLGVELFHLSGNRHKSTVDSAVPPLMRHRRVLLSIADDIRRIYFNLTPPDNAGVQIEKTSVRFHDRKLVYEFGDVPTVLLDKHMDGPLGAIWRVRYFKYLQGAAGLYPRGIVMDNNHFHYRIVVKNRSWAVE
jgi:hypothetical protein